MKKYLIQNRQTPDFLRGDNVISLIDYPLPAQ